MALDYLSDDEFSEIYGKAERKARRAKRKAKRAGKKAKRKTKRSGRRTKRKTRRGEKKAGTRPRTVARIGLAAARGAFLTVIRLNGLKMATKLARTYHKGKGTRNSGKAQLKRMWTKMGGKWPALARAISKGAKQRISADEIGSAIGVAIATATPIIIAVMKIVKSTKSEGGTEERGLLKRGLDLGKKILSRDSNVDKGVAHFDEDEDVAVLDRDDDFKDDRDIDDRPRGFSFFSLAGLLWKVPFVLMLWTTGNFLLDAIISAVSTYCIIGLVLLRWKNSKAVKWYFKPFYLLRFKTKIR